MDLQTLQSESSWIILSKSTLQTPYQDLYSNFFGFIQMGRILSTYVKDTILEQMRENNQFPKALVEYITVTPIKDLEGDGFILLIEIFQTAKFKDFATPEFINALFNSLEYIKEEKVFLSIVHILVSISAENDNPSTNPVLKQCYQHQYKRYFAEAVLLLLNKGKSIFLEKCLKFCNEIFSFDKTKDEFFYTNDLFSLVDIIIREFVNTSEVNLKIEYLTTLSGVIQTNDYKKSKHRANDIKEIFDEIKITEGVDPKVIEKMKQIENLGILQNSGL